MSLTPAIRITPFNWHLCSGVNGDPVGQTVWASPFFNALLDHIIMLLLIPSPCLSQDLRLCLPPRHPTCGAIDGLRLWTLDVNFGQQVYGDRQYNYHILDILVLMESWHSTSPGVLVHHAAPWSSLKFLDAPHLLDDSFDALEQTSGASLVFYRDVLLVKNIPLLLSTFSSRPTKKGKQCFHRWSLTIPSNCRPNSNLSSLSKPLERCLSLYLVDYFDINSLMPPFQYGCSTLHRGIVIVLWMHEATAQSSFASVGHPTWNYLCRNCG